MSKPVKLYGVDASPNVRGAMLALAEKEADFELIRLPPSTWKRPDHLARNPFGKIPVLEDGAFILYETQAVMRHIDRVFPGRPLTPEAPQKAARMDQVLGIIDCYLGPSWIGGIVFERLVAPNFLGLRTNLERVEAAMPLAQTCVDVLEDFLEEPYLAGMEPSLADLRLLPHFDCLRVTREGQQILAGHKRLFDWFDLMMSRNSSKSVLQPLF